MPSNFRRYFDCVRYLTSSGSKKTAVAATPGKTKHFQTLIVSEALLLCDCPGLVLPRYAQSKAEMVAAGVAGHPTLE